MGMSEGIKIPEYARRNAEKGLKMRSEYSKEERPVLGVGEANRKGVHSGVTTARTLIRGVEQGQRLSLGMARRIKSFLSRMHGQLDRAERKGWDEDKIVTSIMVWGGQRDERFLEYLETHLEDGKE